MVCLCKQLAQTRLPLPPLSLSLSLSLTPSLSLSCSLAAEMPHRIARSAASTYRKALLQLIGKIGMQLHAVHCSRGEGERGEQRHRGARQRGRVGVWAKPSSVCFVAVNWQIVEGAGNAYKSIHQLRKKQLSVGITRG